MTQAWHTHTDYYHRCFLLREIAKIFDECTDFDNLRDWQEKRVGVIRKLELALYLNHSSLEDYMDWTTLRERLKDVAFDLQFKKMNQLQEQSYVSESRFNLSQPCSQDVISTQLPHYNSYPVTSINRDNFVPSNNEEFLNVFDYDASVSSDMVCDHQSMQAYDINRVSNMLHEQHPVNQNVFNSVKSPNLGNMTTTDMNINNRESNLHEFQNLEYSQQPLRQSLNIDDDHPINISNGIMSDSMSNCGDPDYLSHFLHGYNDIINSHTCSETNGHLSPVNKKHKLIYDGYIINNGKNLLEDLNKIENRRCAGNICQLLGRTSSNEENGDISNEYSSRDRDISILSYSDEK